MILVDVIIVSTRPSRAGHLVGQWFAEYARAQAICEIEVVDLAALNLPVFNEPNHPRLRQYEHAHTKAWSAIVDRADAFVLVTPEYNYSTPAPLVNALDYLVQEWAYKPVGFVSYGGISGGLRGVQMTKQIVTALKMMPIPEAVTLPFFAEHVDREHNRFTPPESQVRAAGVMLAELVKWAEALKPLHSASVR